MSNPLHNLDDALDYLEDHSVHTSQGTFVKIEDVKEAMKQVREAGAIERATAPRPKTMEQAKRMAKQDPEIMKDFPPVIAPPGRSVPAQVSESPSRA